MPKQHRSSLPSAWSPRASHDATIASVTTSTSPRATATTTTIHDKDTNNSKSKAPASLLKQIVAKNHQQARLDDKQRQQQERQPEHVQELTHDGNNASIVLDEQLSVETPWTPKSLGRAKTAIIYKVRTTRACVAKYWSMYH